MASEPVERRLKRVEYDALVERGFLVDEKVELLRGRIVQMSPQGLPHWRLVLWLQQCVARQVGGDWLVISQLGFAATDDSEPEPDLAVFPMPLGGIRAMTEKPQEMWLVIEVSASSLATDRRDKRAIYAEAGVREYWIVNVAEHCIEVMRDPRDGDFTTEFAVGKDATIEAVHVPVCFAVGDLPFTDE